MTGHRHSDGIMYFCNKEGCTQIKSAATARHTEDDYANLEKLVHSLENQKTGSNHSTAEYNILKRRVGELEGMLASTQFRNSQLQQQVDTNSGEGKFKDYANMAECMKDQIADDPKHDPVAAKRRCDALSRGDLSKEGSVKSGNVANDVPAGMYQFGASLYGTPIDREENNLKSASVENEGTLIGTMYYGKNRPANRIVRTVN